MKWVTYRSYHLLPRTCAPFETTQPDDRLLGRLGRAGAGVYGILNQKSIGFTVLATWAGLEPISIRFSICLLVVWAGSRCAFKRGTLGRP